jgi:hypothetical protein
MIAACLEQEAGAISAVREVVCAAYLGLDLVAICEHSCLAKRVDLIALVCKDACPFVSF